MMRIYNLTITLLIALFLLVGCNGDKKKFFEEERYEKMLYIVSDNDNIHNLVYDLDGSDHNIRNISIACSGTNPTTEVATLTLKEDIALFDKYNYVNFVEDESRFAIKMSQEDYTIESNTVTYPIGAQNTLVPVKIEMEVLEKLNPDKTYLIPMAIESSSPYITVKKKESGLMRIQRKNKYGNTAVPINYNVTGYEGSGYFVITKTLAPLTKNRVRMFIGTKKLPAEVEKQPEFILNSSVVIEIADDNTLTVKPYDSTIMQVETLDHEVVHPGDQAYSLYSNRLDTKMTTFYVYYKYSLDGGSSWEEIREAIRLPIISAED